MIPETGSIFIVYFYAITEVLSVKCYGNLKTTNFFFDTNGFTVSPTLSVCCASPSLAFKVQTWTFHHKETFDVTAMNRKEYPRENSMKDVIDI